MVDCSSSKKGPLTSTELKVGDLTSDPNCPPTHPLLFFFNLLMKSKSLGTPNLKVSLFSSTK